MEKENIQKHESFGTIQISRVQSSQEIDLFGSSIRHRNFITISINKAEVERNLSQDWIHSKEQLIEFSMSPSQFADAITSLNVGGGTPITFESIMMHDIAPCPHTSKRIQFDDEFESDMKETSKAVDDALKQLDSMLNGGKSGKTEMKELKRKLEMLKQNIGSNMPFVYTQFNRQIDKSVKEAKGEIDAFVTSTVRNLGLEAMKAEALKKQMPVLEAEKVVKLEEGKK